MSRPMKPFIVEYQSKYLRDAKDLLEKVGLRDVRIHRGQSSSSIVAYVS